MKKITKPDHEKHLEALIDSLSKSLSFLVSF